jgi:2,4-dienoyl-CoA reductase-like NADH-dependent reductase (Old Yellow Enzyme family)
MKYYPKLFSPLTVGTCVFPNRVMFTAAVTRLASEDGHVTGDMIDRYRRIARGAVGSMVVEAAVVLPSRSSRNLRISEDRFVPELINFVDAIRSESPQVKVGLQIMHFLKISRSGWRQRVEDLKESEIKTIPAMFGAAAGRAKDAGFDFVELHMAHFTTLASLLSVGNRRADLYGGDFPGRVAVPILVIRSVREEVGPDYPIGARINGEEFTKNGNTILHSRRIALALADEGLDYLSVSAGERYEDSIPPPEGQAPRPGTGYSGTRMSPYWWNPDATHVHLADDIRFALRQEGYALPVVTAGKIRTPALAENILSRGKADVIGMARGLFADPDWPEKSRTGRADDIVLCAACGYCSESDDRFEVVRCIQWPERALHPPHPWLLLPPCQSACPAEVNIRGYMELALEGKYEEALRLIKKKIALPGVISRICRAFCEKNCNRANLDEAIGINSIKRLIVDRAGLDKEKIEPVPRNQDAAVAVVGSGPAGLAAAYYLVEKGYRVTVFEALPVAGGMLTIGIPEKLLPRWIVHTEIRNLQRFGVEIKLNDPVGKDGISLDTLMDRGYRAIFLGTGVPHKRKMTLPEQPNRLAEIPGLCSSKLQKPMAPHKGLVKVDNVSLATNLPGVFAGGDVALGPASVVQALAHGRRAATSIDCYLRSEEIPDHGIASSITFDSIDLSQFRKRPRIEYPRESPETGGFDVPVSTVVTDLWEAERCFKCGLFPKTD